jgi:hypothetical protein
MTSTTTTKTRAVAVLTAALLASAPALAEMSAEELAKLAQNPVGNLVSVPFQNNTNFNVGPQDDRTQNILNIQPVIPITLNENWNLITRTIVPLIWQPEFAPGQGTTFGLGDIQLSTFVSPSNPSPSGLIWGAGAIVQMPTASNGLGNKNWGLGPTAVALHLQKGDPWVFGALANNVWSLSNDGRGGSYSNFLLQPFVNYNFPEGFYLTSAPIVTANWKADSGDQWTVPLGGGVGKIFHLGRLPVNSQLSAYYNVVTPDDGADWSTRLQVQFMFPK